MELSELFEQVQQAVYSIKQAAEAADVSTATVTQWINDEDNPHGFGQTRIENHPFGRVTLLDKAAFDAAFEKYTVYKAERAANATTRAAKGPRVTKSDYYPILIAAGHRFSFNEPLVELKEKLLALDGRPDNVPDELWQLVYNDATNTPSEVGTPVEEEVAF